MKTTKRAIEILEAIDPELVKGHRSLRYSDEAILKAMFSWDYKNKCMFTDEYYIEMIFRCYNIDETTFTM